MDPATTACAAFPSLRRDSMISQRAVAMAAFQQKAEAAKTVPEPTSSGLLSARELAMRNLSRKSGATSSPSKGVAGALKSLGVEQSAEKVIPNWKMTAAQKNAAAARAEIRGSVTLASARVAFQAAAAFQAATSAAATASPRPALTATTTPSPASSSQWPALKAEASAPAVASASATVVGGGAKEVEELVNHDLDLLIEGLKRLGTKEVDGSIVAPFAKLVDDESLEQQLESLVGTLKAGRRRGVLDWKGQMLLKGPHDSEPIKLVAEAQPATPAAPEVAAERMSAPALELETGAPVAAEPDAEGNILFKVSPADEKSGEVEQPELK